MAKYEKKLAYRYERRAMNAQTPEKAIDVRDKACKYCGTKINDYQQWYLDKELD